MKRIILSLLSMFMFMTSYAAVGERVFSNLASRDDVTSVYIGKAALRIASQSMFAGKMGMTESRMQLVGAAARNLESVEIISTEKKKAFPAIKETVCDVVKKLGLEVVVEAKEPGENTVVYVCMPEDGTDNIDCLLIETHDNEDYSVVFVKGQISFSELKDGYE